MNRREFLAASGAVLLTSACQRSAAHALPEGDLLGADFSIGHQLRDGGLPEASETLNVPLLIAGAGVAGLSAAWWLQRQGVHDFVLLEGERETGGNARSGRNAISAYPWGAHYLPLPGVEAIHTRQLLAEIGVLQGDVHALKPRYNERYLCAAPAERLFIHGRWQEGIVPQFGVPSSERAEFARFDELLMQWRSKKGRDGRRAFALPMALSSKDPSILALDSQSAHAWLAAYNFSSPALHWYVNYACRDDYGTDCRQTSAWAMLHYFCARTGKAANAEHDTVLTLPEGNGWLVRHMAGKVAAQTRTGQWVWRIGEMEGKAWADVYLAEEDRSVRYLCDQLIWAGPMFQLPYVWPQAPGLLHLHARAFSYAPWLVANISVSALPQANGAEIAWDNTLYDSAGLGYVVATHQELKLRQGASVLTYYRALSDRDPHLARSELLAASHQILAQQVFNDLQQAHPDLLELATRCDIWRWGHAMARPTVGFVHGEARQALANHKQGAIRLAHADLSGFSIFEEAQYRGIKAAQAVLRRG